MPQELVCFFRIFDLYTILIHFLLLGTKRTRNPTRMTEILEAEAHISDSEKRKKCCKRTAKGKGKEVDPELEVDQLDTEFVGSSSDSESSALSDKGDESESEGYRILNEEVRINPQVFVYKIKHFLL